jgi:hypothetical protein
VYDPLGYTRCLENRGAFAVLGRRVEVAATHPAVIEAARESWGDPESEELPSDLRLEFVVSEGGEAPGAPPMFQGRSNWLLISGSRGNCALCDVSARTGIAFLEEATVLDRPRFRYYFLEAMAYATLTQLYFTPVHAAFVVRNGAGILLAGDSGAGKSTLAYACARRGWTYVCDDGTMLVRGERRRIARGKPGQLRLRQEAAALFPELAGRAAYPGPDGKPVIELNPRAMGLAVAGEHPVRHLLFLDRTGEHPPRVEPMPGEEAWRRLVEGMTHLSPSVYTEQCESLERVAELEPAVLRYGDLDAAVDLLDSLAGGD